MAVRVPSGSASNHISEQEVASDDLVVPRLYVAADNFVINCYRILDQFLNLCDAVEEIHKIVTSTIPPHAVRTTNPSEPTDSSTSDDKNLAQMVESWATELASVGSNVVELTSSIRVSPLIDKNIRSDDSNVDYKLVGDARPRLSEEMIAVHAVLDKFTSCTSEAGLRRGQKSDPQFNERADHRMDTAGCPLAVGSKVRSAAGVNSVHRSRINGHREQRQQLEQSFATSAAAAGRQHSLPHPPSNRYTTTDVEEKFQQLQATVEQLSGGVLSQSNRHSSNHPPVMPPMPPRTGPLGHRRRYKKSGCKKEPRDQQTMQNFDWPRSGLTKPEMETG